jgi:hypothetical protein
MELSVGQSQAENFKLLSEEILNFIVYYYLINFWENCAEIEVGERRTRHCTWRNIDMLVWSRMLLILLGAT